jgi:hypothetical protein
MVAKCDEFEGKLFAFEKEGKEKDPNFVTV